MSRTLDLTPDPNVLVALTHTPMKPIDALCELIDNALDSFHYARLAGEPVTNPLIVITLPHKRELQEGRGHLGVRDNGPGLTPEVAEKAMKAGYSSNNPHDTLGLFGMGFNISTGKLGRVTRLFTRRKSDELATEVELDLEEVKRQRSFQVPFRQVSPPPDFIQGTLVEIRSWWPEGNPNSGFTRKLVHYGKSKIREELGRRYATILRKGQVRILVEDEACEPFEHCVWADHRYVERQTRGRIPAVIRFDELLNTQRHCTSCHTFVPSGQSTCPSCGSGGVRSIEERITGWVGIQRFDHPTEFGIDLIRNGRAIRIGEKAAFFEWEDEFRRKILDYPIDGNFGRIVGEVHLNHVPVDYQKEDFQRQSPQWQAAMKFLRGESSLQPKQPGADQNKSPVFLLYQGYRRVRIPGRHDMYPGHWEGTEAKRISRQKEEELRDKFTKRLPGYFDDAEWWKLIEQAEQRPQEELVICPACSAENLRSQDRCGICSGVLLGKPCINPDCGQEIAQSDVSCEHCGTSQVPEVIEPWKCAVCQGRNHAETDHCTRCGAIRGSLHPLSREHLLNNSYRSDELSRSKCSIILADGQESQSVDVVVYITKAPLKAWNKPDSLPLQVFKTTQVEIFLDLQHRVFTELRLRPETFVAGEVALYFYQFYHRLNTQEYAGLHTLSKIEWDLLQNYWSDQLKQGAESIHEEASQFFRAVRERLAEAAKTDAEEIYGELTDEHLSLLVDKMLRVGQNPAHLAEMKQSGEYLMHVSEETLVAVARRRPHLCFDGRVWDEPYLQVSGLPDKLLAETRRRTAAPYLNALETVAFFLQYGQSDSADVRRCQAALDRLQRKLV